MRYLSIAPHVQVSIRLTKQPQPYLIPLYATSAPLNNLHMAPSLPEEQPHPPPTDKGLTSSSAAMVNQAFAQQARLLIPTSVHTHMFASVVNAEAAADAARQALQTAEAVAGKAAAAADVARRKAAAAVAAEEQALRDVALCKAAAAIAVEHHASTVRNLLQLPQPPMAEPKAEPSGHTSCMAASPRTPPSAHAPSPSPPNLAALATSTGFAAQDHDALAVAAATAVARACFQQHVNGNFGHPVALPTSQRPASTSGLPSAPASGRARPSDAAARAAPPAAAAAAAAQQDAAPVAKVGGAPQSQGPRSDLGSPGVHS